MNLEEFYKAELISESENSFEYRVTFNPMHPIYKGHFPKQSVVPGIMQLEIVRHLLNKKLQKNIQLQRVKQIKFLIPILPNIPELKLLLQYKVEHFLNATVQISSEQGIHTKILAHFETKHD